MGPSAIDHAWLDQRMRSGSWSFELLLPDDRIGTLEPLLVADGPGRCGNTVFIKYLGKDTLQIGWDADCRDLLLSPVVQLDLGRAHTFWVDFDPAAANTALKVAIDGELIWSVTVPPMPFDASGFRLLSNPRINGHCRDMFSGTLVSLRRGDPIPVDPPDKLPPFSLTGRGAVVSTPQTIAHWTRRDGDDAFLSLQYRNREHSELVWNEPGNAAKILVEADLAEPFDLSLKTDPEGIEVWNATARVWRQTTRFFSGEPVARKTFVELASTASGPEAPGFAGTLHPTWRQEPHDAVPGHGSLSLRVRLPRGRTGEREPLIVTGTTGAGDAIYIHYASAREIRFGFDHWGAGGPESPPVSVDYDSDHMLWIDMASLDRAYVRGQKLLRIRLDGASAWEIPTECHPYQRGTLAIGVNPIGISTCGARFSGEILSAKRRPEPD